MRENVYTKKKKVLISIYTFLLILCVVGVFTACTEKKEGTINNESLENVEEAEIIGFIRSFKDNKLTFDEIEWVDSLDMERRSELKLTEDDFPNGFYVYNESEDTKEYTLAENITYKIVDWNSVDPQEVDITKFESRLAQYEAPYWITVKGNVVSSITEQYRP